MNRQGLAQNDQKCQLGMGRNRPKMTTFGQKWPKMHILGKIWPFMGQNINFYDTLIKKEPPRQLVWIIFLVGHWIKRAKMQIFGPKKPILGQFVVYGPKILIFMGVSKSFGTHITKKPLMQLVCIVFLVGNWIKWANNAHIWPKMPVLGPIRPVWGQKPIFGDGVKLLVSSYPETNDTPFLCWKHWPIWLKVAARDENVQFWPENWDIWG